MCARERLTAMKSLRGTCSVAILPLLAGCGGENGVAPEPDFGGLYRVAQTTAETTCSPEPLPAPSMADPALYWQVPDVGWDGSFFDMRYRQAGTLLEVFLLDEEGQPVAELAFRGSIEADGRHRVRRSLDLGLEGPREGGHEFYVLQEAEVEGAYSTVEGQLRVDSEGVFQHIFREGSESGAIFTTCTTSFTSTGSRVSN